MTGSVRVSSETTTGLFNESFPANGSDASMRRSYPRNLRATTANRKWLRCTHKNLEFHDVERSASATIGG
jgi:hypothetical protein